MSRNFELLERLQQDRELFTIPPLTRENSTSGSRTNGTTSLLDPDTFAREEVLRLVQSLFLASNGNGQERPRRVVFCGIDKGDGSRLLCTRVARSLAEQVQSPVCIMDANQRVPGASRLFDPALFSDLRKSGQESQQGVAQRILDNLWLVNGDSLSANGDPTLDQLQASIRNVINHFTYVIISAPPVGQYSDAVVLGQMTDGVVLVLEANTTRRAAARRAKLALEAGNVQVLGSVLNNRTFPIPDRIYRLL